MAQFAVLIYAADSAHAPDASSEELAEPDGHAEELLAADAMLAAYAFTPREYAVSVRRDAATPGPFVDAEHVVAGVYVLEADDLDEAVRIAATNPAVRSGGGVEVRPVHSGGAIREPRGRPGCRGTAEVHTRLMEIEQWWARLEPATRSWLIDHNGEPVPGQIVSEIARTGGPMPGDPWWAHDDDGSGFFLPDGAVDWVEADANGETHP